VITTLHQVAHLRDRNPNCSDLRTYDSQRVVSRRPRSATISAIVKVLFPPERRAEASELFGRSRVHGGEPTGDCGRGVDDEAPCRWRIGVSPTAGDRSAEPMHAAPRVPCLHGGAGRRSKARHSELVEDHLHGLVGVGERLQHRQ
jgi:hypothetical protein